MPRPTPLPSHDHLAHHPLAAAAPPEPALALLLLALVAGAVACLVAMRRGRGRAGAEGRAPAARPPSGAAGAGKRHDKLDRTNEAFIAGLGAHDEAWRPDALRARVALVHERVLRAWTARDQALAVDCMAEALYRKRKRATDHMLALGKRHVLEDVRLLDVDLVWVADRQGTDADAFWAVVRGTMVEYQAILDWERYAVACGALTDEAIAALRARVAAEYRPTTVPTSFAELWKFERHPAHGWVLAAIEHDLSVVDDMPRPFSDDTYPHPPRAQDPAPPAPRPAPAWEPAPGA